jgi:hypothetical protein
VKQMKRTILVVSLSLACAVAAYAQQTDTRASGDLSNQTSAKAGKVIQLDSGTRLAGELQNTLDVRKAKVGDQVLLKTTQAVKSGGHTVVPKGSRLIGHVTEVAQKGKGNGASRVGILFDRLEQGSLAVPISATISSITSGRASARSNNDGMFDTGGSASSSTSSRSSASANNGGLLGGVVNSTTSTVGGVVGGTTSAVGTTVDSTTSAVGNTAGGLGRSLGGIQISESSSTSVEGSSVLSLQGGNLRLEKGTNFNLVLTQSASAGTGKNQ